MIRDPRPAMRALYRGVDGFFIPRADANRVRASKGAETYGEIMPTATLQLVRYLELGPRDVFYDLGAGVGKVVMMAALGTTVGRAVGVELSASRCARAYAARRSAESSGLLHRGRCMFRRQDLRATRLSDATVVFTNSTAFATHFTWDIATRVAAVPHAVRFVSTQVLDPHPAMDLVDVLRLDMSWRRRAKVYVYRTLVC